MLTPTYLWYVPEKAEKQAEELHNKIVSVMIERMMIRLGRGDDYLLPLLTSGRWMYCRMQGISCKRCRQR